MPIHNTQKALDIRRLLYVFMMSIAISGAGLYLFISRSLADVGSQTLPLVQQEKLNQAIALALRTKTGSALESFIDQLLSQDKIHLSGLLEGHYGESGEGCVVKEDGNQLSTEEMASALVHEVTHYQMIQANVASDSEPPARVIFFEVSAFAAQYQFSIELEQLNLVQRQKMFADEAETVSAIMRTAHEYQQTTSQQSYDAVFEQLVAYGYPREELNRFVSQRTEKACVGVAK